MIDFLKELTAQFRVVTPESYHEKNRKNTVIYPYLTFDFDRESIERNVDGFYIDVDIFDNNSSYMKVFELEEALTDHFKDNRKLTDDLFIRFNFLRSNKVPTGDDMIKRRNLQFYCKTDWRNK
ncbi:hypothetical protein ABEW12_17040 [Bacillus licheniformis]|uniref:hypothetical protein n=1 Tax=Bacillus licheniformis TaxID=1402 RepID=UPI000B8AE105|nr:hypothetical protein [Bacillus licheniformis]TWM10453.1 hypothetical protein CHCC15091_0950 [Bacillus licheniformis]WIW99380.1 hypothetical protein QQ984_03610 [Bacillus licheniformis]